MPLPDVSLDTFFFNTNRTKGIRIVSIHMNAMMIADLAKQTGKHFFLSKHKSTVDEAR